MVPYFYDQNLEDENEQNPGEVRISGASPTTDNTGSTSGASSNSNKELNTGSGFQNLDKYLQTNQSQKFGQQVLGKVQDQVTDAGEKMTEAGDQFKNQVTSANQLPTQEQYTQAIAKPAESDANQFQGWMNQNYEGPNSLSESQDAWNKYWSGTNQANTSAKLLGNEAGRFTLLDQYFGRPNYNFGEKSLDNLLVQQSGLGRETRNVQNDAAQLKSQGERQARDLQGFASQRAGEVDQNRANVRGAIGLDDQGQVITGENAGAIGKQYQDVYNQVDQRNAARHSEQEALRQALAAGQITRDQMQKLGIVENPTIYNLDPNNYLTQGQDLNRNQVMSPEQRSYIQALSQLAGVDDTFANGPAEEASNPYSFDTNRFYSDTQATARNYTSDIGRAYDVVKSTAPLPGDVLRSITPQDNPASILNLLNNEVSTWNQEAARGNPYAAQRLDALNQSIRAVSDVLTQYRGDPTTGGFRTLQVR